MISISFDMGWNKKSSGNPYDSLSGHALAIGCLSNKILNVVVSRVRVRVFIYHKSDKKFILKQLSPMTIHLCEHCSSIDVITQR